MIDMIYNLRAGDIHAAEFSDEFIHTIEEVKETLWLMILRRIIRGALRFWRIQKNGKNLL